MKKREGFTLVELLAVIVVLAIIMIIAIPSILGTANSAKKESFYLYAQSLESKSIGKYTQDLEYEKDNIECAVYDINKDLDLSNTGSYEGWVKVERVASLNGKQNYEIKLNHSDKIEYVHYCTVSGEKRDCTPTLSYSFHEGNKSVTVSQTLKAGSTLCANYDYASGGALQRSATQCVYSGNATDATFDYKVYVTLKSSEYAVSDVRMNDEMTMKKFYKEIDNFKSEVGGLAIKAPTCGGTSSDIKGTTTTKTTEVTSSTKADASQVIVNTSEGVSHEVTIATNRTTSSTRVVDVGTTETTERGEQNVTAGTTNEAMTSSEQTTTVNTQDYTILLNTLNIVGQDIGFSPLTFYYELDVPNDVTSLSISATPVTPDVSTVQISGHEVLNVGRNVVLVGVSSSETGQVAYYRIIVNRFDEFGNRVTEAAETTTKPYQAVEGAPDPTLEASDASLRYIKVAGYTLGFNKNTYEYSLQVADPDNLKITYQTTNSYAVATMEGDKDLHDGGEVTITVVSQNKYYTKRYKVKILVEQKTSTGTKILRGMAVGFGVVLAGLLSVIGINKAKAKKMIKNSESNKEKDNIINPTPASTVSNVFNTNNNGHVASNLSQTSTILNASNTQNNQVNITPETPQTPPDDNQNQGV